MKLMLILKVTFDQFSNSLNIIEHHPGHIKIEKNNYEVAKQDRSDKDRNLVVSTSDLASLLNKSTGV